MKICPNCGAENNDNAFACVLCEFEFETEESTENIVSNDAAEVIKYDNNESRFDVSEALLESKVKNSVPPTPDKSDFVSVSSSHGKRRSIIAVASLLIIGGGIAGGVYFMKNKNSQPDVAANTGESSSIISTTMSESTSAITTTSEFTTTAKVMSTSVTEAQTTASAQTTQSAIDQNAVKDAYIRKLTEFTKSDKFNAYDHASKYALYDIDNNGIEELIIQYQSIIGNAEILYYYKNGEYAEITSCSESSFEICPESHCVQSYGHGGYTVRRIFTIGEQGNTKDELYIDHNQTYIRNDIGISQSEYNQVMAKYDAMNWVRPSFNTFSTLLSDSVVYAKPRETYAFLGAVNISSDVLNVREAPSTDSKVLGGLSRGDLVSVYRLDGYPDWYKIEYSEKNLKGYVSAQYIIEADTFKRNNNAYSEYTDESLLIAKGKTKLNDGGVLNVRKFDSTEAEIITTIPKDHYVGIISANGDWFYIKYYADTNSPIYYGYVSSQFIEITEYL